MMKQRIIAFAVGFMMLLGVVVAPTTALAQDRITIGYVNWVENVVWTPLVEQIIEANWDVEVDSVMADAAPIFAGLANGDLDFWMDSWYPVTHGAYWDEYGDQFEQIGVNYEGARIGMTVPQYVTIDSIEEVADHANEFDRTIVGIDAGAGVMQATERAIDEYNLPVSLQAASEPAMIAALERAYDRGEWIAVTGWTPHWKFATWDLKFLDDPEGAYGGSEDIYTLARLGFSDDFPEVAQFLANFHMDDDQLGALENYYINDGLDPEDAAAKWIEENPDVVASWLP